MDILDIYPANDWWEIPACCSHLLQPIGSAPIQNEGKTQVQTTPSNSTNSGLQFGLNNKN